MRSQFRLCGLERLKSVVQDDLERKVMKSFGNQELDILVFQYRRNETDCDLMIELEHRMMSWQQREQEESYLRALEELLLQRLRNSDEPTPEVYVRTTEVVSLSQLSIEINEELERLETMIAEELSYCD
jgi:hypothetical protein